MYRSPEDGKRARIKLGTYPALTLAGARDKARHCRGLIEQKIDPRTQAKADAEARKQAAFEATQEAERTFGKGVDDFIARCERAGLRKWEDRRRQFNVYVPEGWRERQVASMRTGTKGGSAGNGPNAPSRANFRHLNSWLERNP